MEQINIYNENHEYLGECEKTLAHKLGLWHEVINGAIVNKKRKSIFFQVKNANHNKVHNVDKIELAIGGHYIAGENLEDGIREIEEESGIKIRFEDLIYLGERQVSTIVKKDYIVREFQKIFIIPYTGEVSDLKCQDDEVKEFIEFKIDDCINLFLKKQANITGKTSENNTKMLSLDEFVESYLKGDELFLRLSIAAKRYVENEKIELLRW